jgi:transcriptional regulator with XRE-family HTH domain
MSKLAQRVRDFRYSKGWGPDELASRAAISRTALYQIESGKTELPRAGTLRRIALALDVSMETLLGNDAAAALAQQASASIMGATGRAASAWLPVEGAGLAANGHRAARYEGSETRFGVEYAATPDAQAHARERDLVKKLHELLATPLGDPVARIVEETYRLLPQARMAASYD